MFRQMRTVVIILGLTMAIAYCDRPQQAPAADAANRSAVRETTRSTAAPKAKNAPDHPGHIAVIDLNKIIEKTGQRTKLEQATQIRERNLQISLRVLQQNVQTNLKTLAEEIGPRPQPDGPKPTAAEQKLIAEWVSKMRNLERSKMEAGDKIRQAHEQQRQANQRAIHADISKMRDRIAPLALQLAKGRGLDVVVPADSVLAHSDAVDITDDVFKVVVELIKAGNFPTVTIPEPLKVVRPPTPPKTRD